MSNNIVQNAAEAQKDAAEALPIVRPVNNAYLLEEALADSIKKFGEDPRNFPILEKFLTRDQTSIQNFQTKIGNEIRAEMRKVKGVPQAEIDNKVNNIPTESKERVQEIVTKFTSARAEVRKKFKNWFQPLTQPADQQIFDEIVEKMSIPELRVLASSPSQMRKKLTNQRNDQFLNSSLLIAKNSSKDLVTQQLRKLVDETLLSPEETQKFYDWLAEYDANKKAPEKLIEFLVSKILNKVAPNTQPSQQDLKDVKQVLQLFTPTITFETLEKYNVLPHAKKEELLEKSYKDIIDDINQKTGSNLACDYNSDEYKWFTIHVAKSDFAVDLEHLDEQLIFDLFIKDAKAKDRLTELLEDQVTSHEIAEDEETHIQTYDALIEKLKDMFVAFAPNLRDKIENNASRNRDRIFEKIVSGNFLNFDNDDAYPSSWKIGNTAANINGKMGIVLTQMYLDKNGTTTVWKEQQDKYFYSYDEFYEYFKQKIEKTTVKKVAISDKSPDTPDDKDILPLQTIDDLREQIDLVDEKGKDKNFEVGTIFVINTEQGPEYVRVDSIDENAKKLTMKLIDGTKFELEWEPFALAIAAPRTRFRRLGKMETAAQFVENFAFIKGDDSELDTVSGLLCDNNTPLIKTDEKPNGEPIWGFKNAEKGLFIEVEFGPTGALSVRITDFVTPKDLDNELKSQGQEPKYSKKSPKDEAHSIAQAKKAYNTTLRKREREVDGMPIDYFQLMQIIQQEGAFEPVEKGKTSPVDEYEKQVKLENGDDMMDAIPEQKWGLRTIGDIYYKFQHIKEYWKKKFELTQEMRSAYAFINLRGPSGLGGRKAMGNLIESTVSDIKDKFAGAQRRKYIRDEILLNPKARPHEVLAGLMLVYDMSGTLYPDSFLQDLQGTKYHWFEKVAIAIGVNPRVAYRNCYEKAVSGKNEIKEHPPEEELIERLFKTYQEHNPFVQAIGGGAKVWKMAADGRKAQQAKGEEEVIKEGATPIARADYIVAKMDSNEFEISLGAIPKLLDKSSDAEVLGVMFAYTAGGAPDYVHYSTSDKIKNIAYTGVPFHGFLFAKTPQSSALYKNIIKMVLKKRAEEKLPGAEEMFASYKKIEDNRPAQYSHTKDEDSDPIYKDLWAFWRKNYKVLHPILQGTDPTLQIMSMDENTSSKDATDIKSYFGALHGETKDYFIEEGLKKFKDDNGYKKTFTPSQSMPYLNSPSGFEYRSLSAPLSALGFKENTGVMDGSDREKVFSNQILAYLDFIKNNPTFQRNPEYQKKQFIISIREIWKKLREKMNPVSRDQFEKGIHTDSYKPFHMLKAYGLDLTTYDMLNKDPNDIDAEIAYQRFILGGQNASLQSDLIRKQLLKQVQDVFAPDAVTNARHKLLENYQDNYQDKKAA